MNITDIYNSRGETKVFPASVQDPADRPWICIYMCICVSIAREIVTLYFCILCICSCICKNSNRNSVSGTAPLLAVRNQPLIEAALQSQAACGTSSPHGRATLKPGQYVDAKYIVGSNSKLPLWIPSNALLLGF